VTLKYIKILKDKKKAKVVKGNKAMNSAPCQEWYASKNTRQSINACEHKSRCDKEELKLYSPVLQKWIDNGNQ